MMRVAIVNDLGLAVRVLTETLELAPGRYQVAWVAGDGREAVARCAADPPDLILMDLVMPVMDGVEATRRIIEGDHPCPVLIVTATVEGHASMVFEAMGWGALDAVATPVFNDRAEIDGAEAFLKKLDTVGKLLAGSARARPRAAQPRRSSSASPLLVAIGASTGGPRALREILSGLPADLAAPVILVQHIDAGFVENLAGWLDQDSPLAVRIASAGARPAPGEVLLAAGPRHLELTAAGLLAYRSGPSDTPYQPSVDIFFSSVARHWPTPSVAVLLTGMGADGATGLLELRRAGWRTIAQDEATCAVFGMPKAAIELGAVERVLPLDQIGRAVLDRLRDLVEQWRAD